ncbi:MAG: flagellar biosynthesis protein FlhB [Nitrospirae bacterium]|nr:flagellar biosynthesis protein FlhB [Nitrospirota bacterium]
MAEGDFEKTEQATPRRRQEAREKGQVARSREIPSVAVLAAGTGALYVLLPSLAGGISDLTREVFLAGETLRLDADTLYPFLLQIVTRTAVMILPLMGIVAAAGAAANVFQFGILFSGQALKPQASRISPIKGFKRIFSLHSLVELVKSLLKIAVVGGVAYFLIRGEIGLLPSLVDMGVFQIVEYLTHLIFKLLLWTIVVLLFLAGLDFAFQKWEHERSLRMSKEEIREEHKRTEGDPMIKARIRALQREMARKRMMAAVPKADVVVTNPTHLAVALAYVHGKMRAPKVVAKGAGVLAAKIKAVAREHGVAVVEDKPLARILYKTVEIGQEIPAQLYKAVAEVLAYVYRLRKR